MPFVEAGNAIVFQGKFHSSMVNEEINDKLLWSTRKQNWDDPKVLTYLAKK